VVQPRHDLVDLSANKLATAQQLNLILQSWTCMHRLTAEQANTWGGKQPANGKAVLATGLAASSAAGVTDIFVGKSKLP
jgi:hypothetical protein